jgi:hypothetical protein
VDAETFAFGPFRLIPNQRILFEDGKPLRLGSRALDILVTLVESAGETIRNDQLIARTGPETVVAENTLRVHVAALRKALGDGRVGKRYIKQPGPGLHLCRAGGARASAAGNHPDERSGRRRQFAGATPRTNSAIRIDRSLPAIPHGRNGNAAITHLQGNPSSSRSSRQPSISRLMSRHWPMCQNCRSLRKAAAFSPQMASLP